MKPKHEDVTADELRAALTKRFSAWQVSVPARMLERALAFFEGEVFEDVIDNDKPLRTAIDSLSDCLSNFAEANPEFDNEEV